MLPQWCTGVTSLGCKPGWKIWRIYDAQTTVPPLEPCRWGPTERQANRVGACLPARVAGESWSAETNYSIPDFVFMVHSISFSWEQVIHKAAEVWDQSFPSSRRSTLTDWRAPSIQSSWFLGTRGPPFALSLLSTSSLATRRLECGLYAIGYLRLTP